MIIKNKEDGGPAFPGVEHVIADRESGGERKILTGQPYGGMTLRDYFAGQAPMPNMIEHIKQMVANRPTLDRTKGDDIIAMELATWAYKFADAMLAERAK